MRPFLVPVAFGILAAAVPAHAAPLYYSFTGIETNGNKDTLNFTVPNPAAQLSSQGGFIVNTTSLLFDGTALSSAANFYPLSSYPADTGLQIYAGEFGFALNGNLFSGSGNPLTSTPVLLTGTFALDPTASTASYPHATYTYSSGTLVVSSSSITTVAPTPEPSTFILLGTGLLAAVAKFRRPEDLTVTR